MIGPQAAQQRSGPLTNSTSTIVYLCPHCLHSEEAAGECSHCGTQVVVCEVGGPDDSSRRPLMDREGNVRTRAPRWWLRTRVAQLMKYFE